MDVQKYSTPIRHVSSPATSLPKCSRTTESRLAWTAKAVGSITYSSNACGVSVKYEEVYLKAYDTVAEAKQSLGDYFNFYNTERRHQSLGNQTPDTVYNQPADRMAA